MTISGGRTEQHVMQVVILHPCTKFEVSLVGLPVSKIWLIFGHGLIGLVTLIFDLT